MICSLVAANAKRGNDVASVTAARVVKAYSNSQAINPKQVGYKTLSKQYSEKTVNQFWSFTTSGKNVNDSTVSVNRVETLAIKTILNTKWKNMPISPYLLPDPANEKTHLDATQMKTRARALCGALLPPVRLVRHSYATLGLTLNPTERGYLRRHLGHSSKVHDAYYVKDTDSATRLYMGPWMRGDQGEDVDFSAELLEPGNERIHLELDTEDQDAGEVLNVVDDDDDSEILDEILIGDIDNNSQYSSPIHRQGNSSGKRGIKTPHKKALRKLFAEALESGIAPRKAEILKAQKTLKWPPNYKYTIVKNFVCNKLKKGKVLGEPLGRKV